jgi:hypothetical protein
MAFLDHLVSFQHITCEPIELSDPQLIEVVN